jgi:hypothetical protein
MPSKLIAYHETSDLTEVYRWSDKLALVKLSGWCMTLVPFAGADEDVPYGAVPELVRGGITKFLETTPSAKGLIAFGELSTWANRLMSERRFVRCGECSFGECDHREWEWKPDFQRVFGHIFDRQVIRDSLQWLYQHATHRDATVEVSVVPHGGSTHEGHTYHVLVMRCSGWCAIIMCCVSTTVIGVADPLFPEAAP